jgi:pimeloyl-ACP methyl ester carboxylesterase
MPHVTGLFAWEAGAGRRALCLHGSGSSGENVLWLADHIPGFHIVAPDRSNYGRSPDANPATLAREVPLLGEFLGDGSHLFGQSYGGVLCLLIAARWPGKVISLAVNEPPAFQLAANDPNVQSLRERLADIYPARPNESPTKWIDRWYEALDIKVDPAPLAGGEQQAVVAMMREQPPWEADIDLERIDQAPFPKLVLSGGWHPAFSAVCDVLEAGLHARRVDVARAGHTLEGPGASSPRVLGVGSTGVESPARRHERRPDASLAAGAYWRLTSQPYRCAVTPAANRSERADRSSCDVGRPNLSQSSTASSPSRSARRRSW